MPDVYFIPKSFPCEYCSSKIEIKLPIEIFEPFICSECKLEQRMTYYGKYFGMIKNVGVQK